MTDNETSSEFLTAEELLNFDDIKEEDLVVPEWGNKKVRIRALSLEQMGTLANKTARTDPRTRQTIVDREMVMALTVYYGLVHPKLSFEHIGRLKAKSAGAITRIVQAIDTLGPTPDSIEEAAKSDAPQLNGTVSIFPSARTQEDSL